jgi:hypothetical protein
MAAFSSAKGKKDLSPLLWAVFRHVERAEVQLALSPEEVKADVDAILQAFGLQRSVATTDSSTGRTNLRQQNTLIEPSRG